MREPHGRSAGPGLGRCPADVFVACGPFGAGSLQSEQAWALNGPCCGDSGHDIAVEPDGSFFIVGNYGALDLDGDGRADLKSEGGHDAIIMKGRPTGKLAWVRAPRSPAM